MSHNIQTMFYTGAKPWHGLGTELANAATSAQAIQAAGLDWQVKKEPLAYPNGDEAPGVFGIRRLDNMTSLGSVGSVYQPLQNKDAFSFMDAIVGAQEAMYHTAGALGKGECVWMLAKLPGFVRVTSDDVTEKFLLLTNRHDGDGSVQIFFTPIRVVCQNTLNIALGESKAAAKLVIRHTASLQHRVSQAREKLGIIAGQYAIFEELSKKLAAQPMTAASFQKYAMQTGVIPAEDKRSTRAQNIMADLSNLFEHGKGNDLPGVRGTAWAGFNALVEYVDYKRGTRGDEQSQRTKSLLFGSGAAVKQKAWDAALSLVG